MARQIPQTGIDLVKSFEGLRLTPYFDSVKIPTIGFGTTFYEDGTKVTMADPAIDEARAEKLLAVHLTSFAASVEKLVNVPIGNNQFAALTSFVYNLGAGSLAGSTLLKKLNAGDSAGAAEEFEKWNKAGGTVLPGLTRRRQAEKALFLQGSGQLGDGPSDQDIQVKLEDIENGGNQ